MIHLYLKNIGKNLGKNLTLEDLDLEVYKKESDLFEDDIYQAIDLKTCLKNRKSQGGPGPEEVLKQIAYVEGKIS